VENDSASSFVNWVLERVAAREQQCLRAQFATEEPTGSNVERPESSPVNEALWEGANEQQQQGPAV